MRIRDREGTTTQVTVGGVTYEATSPGRFEVPPEVGAALTRFPHFSLDTEEAPEIAASPDELTIEELKARIETADHGELEQLLEAERAGKDRKGAVEVLEAALAADEEQEE